MSQPANTDLPEEPRWHDITALAVVWFGTLAVMGRLCFHEFTYWDDVGTVFQNPLVASPSWASMARIWIRPLYGLYVPITYSVWAGIACIARVDHDPAGFGLNPWLFHAANVLAHLLTTSIVYRILRLLEADSCSSAAGALLFGMHPLQVETVAWVSGLKDGLSGLFAMIAVWQFIVFALSDLRKDDGGRVAIVSYLLATVAFVAAMLAKPSAMALPLATLAIDRWIIGRRWRGVLATALAWTLIVLPIALIARAVQDAINTPMPGLPMRPLIALDSLAFYLMKLAFPWPLTVDYSRTPAVVIAHGWCYWDWIFPVGVAAWLIGGARRRPVLLAAGLIFLAGCLPVLGYTPALFQFFSTVTDHYLYFSIFGPAIALAWALSTVRGPLLRGITVGILLIFAFLSILQGGYWANDRTLFTHDIAVNPDSCIGYINLGGDDIRDGNFVAALQDYRRCTASRPDWPVAWGSRAAAASAVGNIDEAIDSGRRAVNLQITHPLLRTSWLSDNALLGHLLFVKNRFAEAIPYLRTAAELNPSDDSLARELKEALRFAATQPSAESAPAATPLHD
jgi:hypothetical protein